MGEAMYFHVHTAQLIQRCAEMDPKGLGVMHKPLTIFRDLLALVAKRATELNDPQLDSIMMALTLYEVADPESKDYDPAIVAEYRKIFAEYMKADEVPDEMRQA